MNLPILIYLRVRIINETNQYIMKQRFTLLPALWSALVVMLFAAPPASADVTEDQLEFTKLEDNTWEVKAVPNQELSGRLVIPAYHEDLPVTSIACEGFKMCWGITSIELPSTIVRLGEGCFSDTGIRSIRIPESVSRLEASCFAQCDKLESVEMTESITELGNECFNECYKLKRIDLPSSITRIGDLCFADCESLTEIILPESLVSIGRMCFFRCKGISELELPKSLSHIGANAFGGMTVNKLTMRCSLDPKNSNISESEDICFVKEEFVFACETVYFPEKQFEMAILAKFTFSEGVVNIPDRAFEDTNYKFSEFPEGLVSIGDYAFKRTYFTKEIVIPSSVRHIGTGAFAGCPSLTKVEIKEGVTTIGDGMFMGCSLLKEIVLPGTLTSIGAFAFYHCPLETMEFPQSLAYIGYGAFARMLGFSGDYDYMTAIYGGEYGGEHGGGPVDIALRELSFPDGPVAIDEGAFAWQNELISFKLNASKIGREAFCGCESLRDPDITVHADEIGDFAFKGCGSLNVFVKCDGVKRIGEEAFAGCPLAIGTLRIPDSVVEIGKNAFNGTNVSKLILGAGMTDVGSEAFRYMISLTDIVWSKGLRSIGDKAFIDSSLASLILPDGLERIGTRAFGNDHYNTFLSNVTIPTSVKEVGESCFGDNLAIVEMMASTPLSLQQKNLGYDSEKAAETLVLVPRGAREAYLEDPMWAGFCIKERDTGKVTITMDENTLFQEAYEAQTDVAPEDVLELKIIGYVKEWADVESLKVFNNCMVYDLGEATFKSSPDFKDNKKLRKISLPHVENFGTILAPQAFDGCSSLESIELPDGIIRLNSGAFRNCCNLREVKFPTSLETIDNNAFENTGLREIDLSGTNLNYLGAAAFASCKSLKSVVLDGIPLADGSKLLPDYIQEGVFEGCFGLRSVKMRDTDLETIGPRWFKCCWNLNDIELPRNLKTISEQAFDDCRSLSFIELPETLQSVGKSAFRYSGIRSINLPSGVKDIAGGAFEGAFASCTQLVSVKLPASVKELGNYTFDWCYALKHIISPAATPPLLQGEEIFDRRIYDRAVISVPSDAVETYRTAEGWNLFRNFDSNVTIDSEMDDDWVDTSVMDPDTYDDVKDDITSQEEEDEKNNPGDPENAAAPRRVNEAIVREKLLRTFAPVYDRMVTSCDEGNRGCYVHIRPKGDAKVIKVEFDGKDITSELKDGLLLLPPITKSGKLKITTDRDGTSGVGNAFMGKCEKGVIYDLYGRRVLNPGKGIYIKDGKKIVL